MPEYSVQDGHLILYCSFSTRQASAYDREKVAWLDQNCGTVAEMLAGVCEVYAERPAFAYCSAGSVDWHSVTYREFWARVQALAAGRLHDMRACMPALS